MFSRTTFKSKLLLLSAASLLAVSYTDSALAGAHSKRDMKNKDMINKHRFYVKGEIGGSVSSDVDWQSDGAVGGNDMIDNKISDDAGTAFNGGVGVGYIFSDNLRAELAFNYRTGYEFEGSGTNAGSATNIDAELDNYSLMANIFYDFKVSKKFKPYIGAGIGFAHTEVDDVTIYFPGPNVTFEGGSGDSTDFAMQLTLGAEIPITDRLSLDAGYRYFDAGEFEIDTQIYTSPTQPSQEVSGAKGDLAAHEFYIAARYYF